MFACIHAAGGQATLLACAQAFSPRIEQTAPDTVVLDISGLDHLFGSPHRIAETIAQRVSECGLKGNVAAAQNPDAAIHAARGFDGVTVIPCGQEAAYLGSLPLTVLSPGVELHETLERWGIRTFGDLATLPETGISDRLGPEGVYLRKLARGAVDRPLVPADAPLHFEEEMELEYPIGLLEQLSFILARLLNQLCARLEARALAANEIRLLLKLENQNEHARALRLPVPMRDAKAFLKLLQLDLNSHPPQACIVNVRLAAAPVKPRVTQHGLFLPLSPEPEKLEVTLARLKSLTGENNVGCPELLDTHRPGAFRLRSTGIFTGASLKNRPPRNCLCYLAFRVFRPPRQAKVQAASGQPMQILAQGIRGRVISVAGPWRTSGDWWTRDAWARDEWDIALSDGALYRIYCERENGWFVEGSYD